jgi:phosphoribosyl 1,2-cyclic phosphodiesterase
MHVTIFGSRGSIAVSGRDTIRYGGNTSTVEVRGNDGTLLVLDAGTGIRPLGMTIGRETQRIDILLTHLHMDHIQGLGFFGPLYNPGIDKHIWGPASSTLSLAERLSRYLSPPIFPVHLRDLPRVTFHHIPCPMFDIGPFRIKSSLVCHPGPTVGFRIEEDDSSAVYIPDHELALGNRDGQRGEPEWISGFDLAAEADLLIHDAQYSDEEYQRCIGWGHSTYQHAFEFAAQVGARELVTFHHDPSHDDKTLDHLLAESTRLFQPSYRVSAGQEGAVFKVGL